MRILPGIVPAWQTSMPTAFALVMLPVIALVGLFTVVVRCDGSFAAVLAGAIFLAVTIGAVVGASRIARDVEGPGQ